MRTNIEIDKNLIDEAMKISVLKTKKVTVEAGLRLILNLQEKIKSFRGKMGREFGSNAFRHMILE